MRYYFLSLVVLGSVLLGGCPPPVGPTPVGPTSPSASIGNLEVVGRPFCLTGFNACEDLGGYESLARAFYLYVNENTPPDSRATISTTGYVHDATFSTIMTSVGDIDPSAFVTEEELYVSTELVSLPDVLVVPIALSATQWGNVSAGGEGFILTNNSTNLTVANNSTDLYIVNVDYSSEPTVSDCSEGNADEGNADVCITVRNNIGDLLGASPPSAGTGRFILDLYVVGSGFAMLKVLFPTVLDAEGMFDIVENTQCRDSGNYFSFKCVVDEDNIDISSLTPVTKLPIGNLKVVGSSCLTGFNACETLGGYESLARAFYHHVDTFDGSPVSTTIDTTMLSGGTVLGGYFPTITTPGGDIDPLDTSKSFVMAGVISALDFPDVLLVPFLDADQWALVSGIEDGEGFVLANDVEQLLIENTNENVYIVNVDYSSGLAVSDCSEGNADACITVRKRIGDSLNDDGTVSTGTSSDTLDLYVLGSGFAMLKVLFPDDLNARDMFNIVINTECLDNGYFSFKCVVNEDNDNIEISYLTPVTKNLPIGTLDVGGSSCLTGFNACVNLSGYESLARAFYLYVDDFTGTPEPTKIGTLISGDNTALGGYFPTITTSGGDIDPSAFVTVENIVISGEAGNALASLPDVFVVSVVLNATQWGNVSAGGKGFVLANYVQTPLTENTNENIYVVRVNYDTEGTVSACTSAYADACITVRENIGALLSSDGTVSTGTASDANDLYVLGSGFAMLKVLFPDDLNAKRMFDIVTNTDCRDSGYFSFKCVVNGDNIEISYFTPGTDDAPIGTLALEIKGGRPSCLTRFNACETLGGYEPLARAFYHYVDTFDGTPVSATIGTNISDAVLKKYFPMITPYEGTAINPLDTNKPFVTVEVSISSLNDVVLVNFLTNVQWTSVNAGGEGFVLANAVTSLTEADNASNLYIVNVDYSSGLAVSDCSEGNADACITVRKNIGDLLNDDGTVSTGTSSTALDLYVLGSGFVMLKVLFPDALNAKRMFDIVTNGNCRDSGNYFSFECVVNEDNDNIDISSFIPSISSPIGTLILKIEGGRPSCLTGFNACVTLGGYESLARAFYLYVDDFTGTQVPTTIGTTLTDGSTVLGEYFPTITPPGGDIDPSAFVTVADFDVSTVSSLPSMLMTENLGLPQWENVSAGGEGFVLANDVRYLTAADNGSDLYITDVSYSTEEDAPNCSEGNADACITVRNGIGSKGDTINSTLDLYVLGSGFAMLKVLFPDNLDAEGMFDIVTNAECRDTNGYFSFECLVIDNTRIVPTVPEEESTSGEASSSQNKPLTSAFARLLVRSLVARHAPSKDGTYFTQEKTVLEEGSILITQQGTSATSGTSVGGTSVRAIRMRAVYRGEGASVGTLVGAYRYNHTLSALSRDAVDMRVELGMVGDVDVLSGMKLYGHILGVYETGVLTVAFGEHRVDRMMGVGVVGLSYRVSSGANVLADAAIEGRCSVGNAVWVAGSVAYASSFCDTILKLRISF